MLHETALSLQPYWLNVLCRPIFVLCPLSTNVTVAGCSCCGPGDGQGCPLGMSPFRVDLMTGGSQLPPLPRGSPGVPYPRGHWHLVDGCHRHRAGNPLCLQAAALLPRASFSLDPPPRLNEEGGGGGGGEGSLASFV